MTGHSWRNDRSLVATRQLSGDDAVLVDRIQKLRRLLPSLAQEAADARREVARLRAENAQLKRRVAALEKDR